MGFNWAFKGLIVELFQYIIILFVFLFSSPWRRHMSGRNMSVITMQ
jgi:hypothetical protein